MTSSRRCCAVCAIQRSDRGAPRERSNPALSCSWAMARTGACARRAIAAATAARRARARGRTDLGQNELLPTRDVSFDLVVLFGGDGAILAAAHRMRGKHVPCVGVRLGVSASSPNSSPRPTRPRSSACWPERVDSWNA